MSGGRRAKPAKPRGSETDWRLLTVLAVFYGVLYVVTAHLFAAVPTPLPADADPLLFSEGRARQHLDVLARQIGHRQVGTPGEEEAAQYLLRTAQQVADLAAATRPDLVVEAARESVSGGVTMHAFKFEIANVYANLSNVVLRLAPADPAAAGHKALLVNSHYDSTLGTVGASDCASTVSIMLELARTLVANPAHRLAAPLVFLFNGGEETLSQAANGFFASSRFAQDLGAFINLESTGPWGPDVVFQHTGDWTLQAYARAAPHPRGTTMAQDFFDLGLIPADTDYRMFSYRHYGGLPGVDVAFIFDGTAYHTARDEPGRIRAGTLQDMGHNVLAAIQEFCRVLAAGPPPVDAADAGGHVYFDLWGRAMVIYSHAQAKALHHAPLAIVLLLPLLARADDSQQLSFAGLARGTGLALASMLGGLLLPVAVGAGRALLSGFPMPWYGRPAVAYATFLPAAAAGVLLPHVLAPAAAPGAAARGTSAAGRACGTALLFALLCSWLTSVGMHSSFFYALWAASAALAAALLGTGAAGGGTCGSWRGAAALVACFAPAAAVALPSAITFMAHVMEKVGLAGAAPGLLGLVSADAAVGAVAGASMLVSLGTLAPHMAAALGARRGRALAAALLAASVGAAAWSSAVLRQPYSREHPKRLLVQHIHQHAKDGSVTASKLAVVGLDSFALEPVLPASWLAEPPAPASNPDWESFYPINYLVQDGVARAADGPPAGEPLPTLRLLGVTGRMAEGAAGSLPVPVQRLELELDTGRGGAWGVMNITGPVLAWSLSDRVAATDLPQGGQSHMVRFAGNMHAGGHRFWLERPAGSPLRVRLYVKHLRESEAARALIAGMPDWASPAAVECYHSSWEF